MDYIRLYLELIRTPGRLDLTYNLLLTRKSVSLHLAA